MSALKYPLQVYVTERTMNSAQQIANFGRSSTSVEEVDIVVQGGVGAGRRVEEGVRAGDGGVAEDALFGVKHLPDPPDTIEHGMVQVEGGISGRGEDVTAWVTSEGVVTTAVDANGAGSRLALYLQLEVGDILGLQDVGEDGRGIGIAAVDLGTEIAFEAAGVV